MFLGFLAEYFIVSGNNFHRLIQFLNLRLNTLIKQLYLSIDIVLSFFELTVCRDSSHLVRKCLNVLFTQFIVQLNFHIIKDLFKFL